MIDQSKSAEPRDPRVEAALREYLERVDRGEPVDRDEFLARHAPIAEQLRSFIAAEEDLRKLAAAGAETPRDQARDSTKSFVGQGQETVVPQLGAKRNVMPGLEGRFGRYRIIRALGKGAMGTVYLAEDTQIERQVALKTPHFTEDPTGEQLERFFREARAAGNLRHPNICPIHDFGQIDGRHFITMAYIEGRPLSAFIQPDSQQAERQILLLVRKLALALQEAHDQGVVHRDLKPANIMVDKKGEPIIMDFGLAQQTRRNGDVRLTQTGNILGTPAFMSPEQVEGEPEKIGPPADQYGLGVILYELLTGELPFRGSVAAVMGQILTKEPSPPSQLRPDLDLRIEAACLKMMAKNPAERFRSLKAVADEISSILKSPAAKTTSNVKPASPPATLPAGDRRRADVGASQVLESLKQKTLTERDLESLEELGRKCYSRRDFEQVIQIIERVPEKRRSAALQALLEKSRGKADEISFLICDIDEAERLNDRQKALKKADELLKIKPGHHRALEVQEKFAGYGKGGAARIGGLRQFTQPWNEGGWIPWSALAFGLAVFGVATAVIVTQLGKTAVVIDITDPGVQVEIALKGNKIGIITGPKQEKVDVEPGPQELTIRYSGLKAKTRRFELMKGQKRTVTVSIVNKTIVAFLDHDSSPLIANSDNGKVQESNAKGEEVVAKAAAKAEVKHKEFVKERSFTKEPPGHAQEKQIAVAKVSPPPLPVAPRPPAVRPAPKPNVAPVKFFGRPVSVTPEWTIENDELVQPKLVKDKNDSFIAFGNLTLSNYDLTVEAKMTSGSGATGIDFHWLRPGHYLEFHLTDNHGIYFSVFDKKDYRSWPDGGGPRRLRGYSIRELPEQQDEKRVPFSSNQWHSLRIEARGQTVRAYLDGVLQFKRTDARFSHGLIRLWTGGDTAARFRGIRLSDSEGKVLLEGLPELSSVGERAAKTAQKELAERSKTPVISSNSLGMKLALIPPGELWMGSPLTEKERSGDEWRHSVEITKPFYLGVYEVTQTEFEQLMGRNPSFFSNSGGQAKVATGVDTSRYPVDSVTWYEAVEFCNKLSEKEQRQPYYRLADIERDAGGSIKLANVNIAGGGGYRLPTEAQWEYACRAGTTTPFNFGTADNGAYSNCNGKAPYGIKHKGPNLGSTVPVGGYRPNAFGLYDMHGNVWEWCWDEYQGDYHKNSSVSDSPGPSPTPNVARKESKAKNSAASDPSGSPGAWLRVCRGGDWSTPARWCRSAMRDKRVPASRTDHIGFRVARDSDE